MGADDRLDGAQGINTVLAVTGQEAVWRLVLQDLGFTRKQRDDFLVGPAYFPWGWMGNIDGLGGPLPDSWIDSHIELERRILARERSLGMTPVLQAFTGHVPESIKQVFPAAKIHQTGNWSAGFSGTWFLDPLDPLFQRFGDQFIKRQTELYGTDHLYAADPFNEIDPPYGRRRTCPAVTVLPTRPRGARNSSCSRPSTSPRHRRGTSSPSGRGST